MTCVSYITFYCNKMKCVYSITFYCSNMGVSYDTCHRDMEGEEVNSNWRVRKGLLEKTEFELGLKVCMHKTLIDGSGRAQGLPGGSGLNITTEVISGDNEPSSQSRFCPFSYGFHHPWYLSLLTVR